MKKLAWLLAGLLLATPAAANQSNLWSPTTGTVSGLQLSNNYNGALSALASCNSGTSAPTNEISGAPVKGQCWLDSSATPNTLKYFDGTLGGWLIVGWFDAVNHIWTPVVGGGAVNNVSSAATTDLCSTQPAYLNVTGVVTITSFGSNCTVGQIKVVTFTGALLLTNNAVSLILPGNANITTAAGDMLVTVYLGSGNWKVLMYQLQTGGQPGTASLTTADQTLSGGANVTAFNNGSKSSGTFTVDCGKNPLQYFTNGGAFTLAAPANDGSCDLLDTNSGTAGTITFSGFTVSANTGDALTTTNTNLFIIHVERINGVSTYIIKALQ